MDTLFLTTTTTTTTNSLLFFPRPISSRRKNHPQKLKIPAFAAKEDPKFDQWDLMELKFGKLLGEDPKLTVAKIKARKVDPDASYLDIEKQFKKNKGKIVQVEEVPFDVSEETKSSSSSSTSLDGLNLARPVLKKGVKFKGDANVKPKMSSYNNPSPSAKRAIDRSNKTSSVPNVILRKPTVVNEDDVEDLPSRLRMKPNLSLKFKTKEQFSDMTLLRRPEPASTVNADDDDEKTNQKEWQQEDKYVDFTLLKKPTACVQTHPDEQISELQGMHPLEQSSASFVDESSERTFVESSDAFAAESALQGKPKRLGLSTKEREETSPVDSDVYGDDVDINSLHLTSPIGEHEDSDWTRAEDLVKSGGRADVELISCSTRGFVVSFGSLIGFLPYRNLTAKWKFLAFESWLRRKGLDPSMYKQNLGIIGNYDRPKNTYTHDSSLDQESEQMIGKEILPDMKLDDLLRIYDLEKLKFLSSFVGQKINVNVIMADRKFRKLLFSVRPKEKEELVEQKRSLMAKLRVGDVVKCCIKKITYFGVFVEVEGVPALIHQTEVSWDVTLDPASYFKIGQVVEAKVHQLDFALDRIFLSLKEITPDPLIEALESVVGGHDPLDGRLEAAEADSEWDDVKSLIQELQQIEGIESVSKGRFFLSPGLAPTFQVYMASMFDNQYKLLARSGNKVQEVIVKASLDKEEMKSTILLCTNRVK